MACDSPLRAAASAWNAATKAARCALRLCPNGHGKAWAASRARVNLGPRTHPYVRNGGEHADRANATVKLGQGHDEDNPHVGWPLARELTGDGDDGQGDERRIRQRSAHAWTDVVGPTPVAAESVDAASHNTTAVRTGGSCNSLSSPKRSGW